VQLEARQLHGDGVVGRRAVVRPRRDHLDERAPDVARGDGPAAGREEDRLEHRHGRRLAVGARDRQPGSGRASGAGDPQPPGQLRLPDHLHPAAGGVGQQRRIRPPARGRDDELGPLRHGVERAEPARAGVGQLAHDGGRGRVGEQDVRPLGEERPRRRGAGDPQPGDEDRPSVEVHRDAHRPTKSSQSA
jgi:hypothetical protein